MEVKLPELLLCLAEVFLKSVDGWLAFPLAHILVEELVEAGVSCSVALRYSSLQCLFCLAAQLAPMASCTIARRGLRESLLKKAPSFKARKAARYLNNQLSIFRARGRGFIRPPVKRECLWCGCSWCPAVAPESWTLICSGSAICSGSSIRSSISSSFCHWVALLTSTMKGCSSCFVSLRLICPWCLLSGSLLWRLSSCSSWLFVVPRP